MQKIIVLAGIILFFGLALCFAQETLTITTYYPSPYGVYKNLRLYPNDDSTPGTACSNPGEMYYDDSAQTLYICSGSPSSTWIPAPGAIAAGVPSGAVMFFNLASCPAGWTELTSARGRYVVGLPSGGTLAGTAGTALSNLENRPTGDHSHGFSMTWGAANWGSWCCPAMGTNNYAASSNTGGTGYPAGTNAPYIQLRVCQKD